MATIFTKIVDGEIPSHKIAETENCYAFLDINPLKEGHTLVIPKKEINYLFDLEDNLLSELNILAKKIAKAIEKVIPCKRIGVAVLGLEVPHAHIHLIPIDNLYDIEFSKQKLTLSNERLEEIAQLIRNELNKS